MRLDEVIETISRDVVPLSWAETWDNSGMMTGGADWEISKVGVCLDVHKSIMDKASTDKVDLIVSHHPFIFSGLKFLDVSTPMGRIIDIALRNRIAIMSLHTNWDNASFGMNPVLSRKLGLTDIVPLCRLREDIWGIGALGVIKEGTGLRDIALRIKERWDLDWCRVWGKGERKIHKVALCGGSGGDLWKAASDAGADVFITADIKYHQIIEAVEAGLAIISVDHGEMERNSLDALADILSINLSLPVNRYYELPLDSFQVGI